MPNWCSNFIRINGDSKTISIITEACKRCEGKSDEYIFQNLIDKPHHMTEEQYQKDWYDTNLEWFGTKWDVSYEECEFDFSENEINLNPQTAWSPPIKFLENLVRQYDGIEAYIFYSEPGCDFSGETKIWKGEDGHVFVDDDEYPYLEGMYKLDKEMFWSEVNSHIEYFKDEHLIIDEEGNCPPVEDDKINEYLDSNFGFIDDNDREDIFKQFKQEVNG